MADDEKVGKTKSGGASSQPASASRGSEGGTKKALGRTKHDRILTAKHDHILTDDDNDDDYKNTFDDEVESKKLKQKKACQVDFGFARAAPLCAAPPRVSAPLC